jgi:lysozyme
MSERVQGIDVSKWQGEMDWNDAIMAGTEFAFIRAGSCNAVTGQCYEDYQFERNAQEAGALIPVGFYWYFRPNFSPIAQADYFCALINAKDWQLPPVCDVEVTGGLSRSAVADSLKLFLDRVEAKTTVKPIIYTRSSFFNYAVEQRDYWSRYDLWIARYASVEEPWGNLGDAPYVQPRDWTTWRFWQHSADGNGKGAEYGAKSKSIDLNVFNGDVHAFYSYLGFQVPVPPPTDPEQVEPIKLVKVTANALNCRQLPDAGSKDFGELIKNSQVPVTAVDGDWLLIKGWIHKDYVQDV